VTLEFREHAIAPRAGGRAVVLLVGLMSVGLIGGGCVSYDAPASPRGYGATPHPRATLASATLPIDGNGASELARLGDRPADLLRRGWILMETRQPTQAIHVLNRVLYKKPTPPLDAMGLAYYLRGRAFQYRGEKRRALEDCRKARAVSQRMDLRRRCDLEIARLAPPETKVARAATGRESAGKVHIIRRSKWNAGRPVRRRLDPMRGVRKLTIHHSAVLSRDLSSRAVAMQIRSIQGFHIQQNGWGDIGYHYLIDPAGRIWEGRSLGYQGAHAGGVNNEHNIGICLLGNFVPGRRGQQPSTRQVQSMEAFVNWLGSRYSISRGRVLTHKEINPGTVCPGPRLQTIVNRMRRHLAIARRPGNASVPGGSR
jgi:N-acetylmuramoyl-L-alanine amidase